MPSVDDTHAMILRGEKPTEAITRAFDEHNSSSVGGNQPTVPAKLERDAQGRVIRRDWGPSPAAPPAPLVPTKYDADGKPVVTRPDWAPRSEQTGRFIAKTAAMQLQAWEEEGTAAQNVAKVQAAEQSMLAMAPTLAGQIEKLPQDIAVLAADFMRLTPAGFGREDKRFSGFLDALSESQFETFRGWFANLSADEQGALLDTVMGNV